MPPSSQQNQLQQALQYIRQRASNMRCFAAPPKRREGQQADQIIDAALQALDLFYRMCFLFVHFYAIVEP